MNLPKIQIIGSGGAFDVQEGNSSFLIDIERDKVLVDCGWSVYSRLKSRNLTREIDYVCITHTHDDHIGSLSALISDRYLIHGQRTKIITNDDVWPSLALYLYSTAGHREPQIELVRQHSNIESFYTSGLHVAGMPSCGFVMRSGGSNLIYSGDIGMSLANCYLGMASFNPANTVVFHDATTHRNPVHTHYEDLKELSEVFAVYGYHHSLEEEDEILNKTVSLETVAMYPNKQIF